MSAGAGLLPQAVKQNPRVLLCALVYIEFIATFETMMIYGAIGLLYRLFGDPVLVGWVITAYMLTSACLVPLVSRLGDLYGRQRMLVAVMAVVTVGSFISAVSPDITGLLVGRALQGAAGAALPLCYGLVREHMPADKVAMGTGIVAATLAIASGVGIFAGGVIVDHLPWHSMFWIAGVASVVAVAVAAWVLPSSRTQATGAHLDLLGAVLMVPVIAGSLYAIGQIKQWGIGDWRIWALLGFSGVLGAVWFRREWKHEHPLIDVRLLTSRNVLLVNLVMMAAAYGVMQSGPIGSMMLQQPVESGVGFGMTASDAGLLMFFTYILGMVGGPASGVIASRWDASLALRAGTLVAAVGWVCMAFGQQNVVTLLVGLFVQAVGTTMMLAAIPMVLATLVPLGRTSEANGVVSLIRQGNIAIAVQITAFILSLQSVSVGENTYPAAGAVSWAFILLAGSAVLAFVIALLLPRNKIISVGAAKPA